MQQDLLMPTLKTPQVIEWLKTVNDCGRRLLMAVLWAKHPVAGTLVRGFEKSRYFRALSLICRLALERPAGDVGQQLGKRKRVPASKEPYFVALRLSEIFRLGAIFVAGGQRSELCS